MLSAISLLLFVSVNAQLIDNPQKTITAWAFEKLNALTGCRLSQVACVQIACTESTFVPDPNSCCGGTCVPYPQLHWLPCPLSACRSVPPPSGGTCSAVPVKREAEQLPAPVCTQGTLCWQNTAGGANPANGNTASCWQPFVCGYDTGSSVQPTGCV